MNIKQISATDSELFALTEDGRVFLLHLGSREWHELPKIPGRLINLHEDSLENNLLRFHPRLQSALRENNINDMNSLVKTPFAELRKMHGIGRGSILEIYRKLHSFCQVNSYESISFLRGSREALERELPNITDSHYRDHIRHSLCRFDAVQTI